MIDPSSSEEESDDDHRQPVPSTHPRAQQQQHSSSSTIHSDQKPLAAPATADTSHHSPHQARSSALVPGSTSTSPYNETHSSAQASSLASSSTSTIGTLGGTPARGGNLPRPTSPSPSLVSDKTTVVDNIDPQVRIGGS